MTEASHQRFCGVITDGLGRGVIRAAVTAAIVTGFLGGAITAGEDGAFVYDNVALAKGGNGGGKGGRGGHGGGHGRGHTGDHGNTASHDDDRRGIGRGHAKGHGHGPARGHNHANGNARTPGAPGEAGASASENGINAAALGSLNASHASATARENASPKSMVGHIAAFADAVESENIDAAAEALAAKANKAITESVVTEVARHAQVQVSEETATAIAERAAAIQAGESEEPMGQSMPGGS